MLLKEGCAFCYEKSWPHFAKYGRQNLNQMTVAESDVWIAKPDILPAQPQGLHFVMRPKDHVLNYMSADTDSLGRFIYGIERRFGPVAIMKHGDVKEEAASVMSVRHDHTHLFPSVDIRVIDYVRDLIDSQGIPYQIIDAPDISYLVQLQKVFKGQPYLYVQHGGVGLFVNDEHEQLGSQQIQHAMQCHFNGATFNWKNIDSNPDLAKLSVERLSYYEEKFGKI